jgi:hypothetical protein
MKSTKIPEGITRNIKVTCCAVLIGLKDVTKE